MLSVSSLRAAVVAFGVLLASPVAATTVLIYQFEWSGAAEGITNPDASYFANGQITVKKKDPSESLYVGTDLFDFQINVFGPGIVDFSIGTGDGVPFLFGAAVEADGGVGAVSAFRLGSLPAAPVDDKRVFGCTPTVFCDPSGESVPFRITDAAGTSKEFFFPTRAQAHDSIKLTFFAERTLTTTPVPLPAGLPLLVGALGLMAVSARRRRA
jgi:hypothetical protein